MEIKLEIPKSLYMLCSTCENQFAKEYINEMLSQNGLYKFRTPNSEFCAWYDFDENGNDLDKGYIGFLAEVKTQTIERVGYMDLETMEEYNVAVIECSEMHHLYDATVVVIDDENYQNYCSFLERTRINDGGYTELE